MKTLTKVILYIFGIVGVFFCIWFFFAINLAIELVAVIISAGFGVEVEFEPFVHANIGFEIILGIIVLIAIAFGIFLMVMTTKKLNRAQSRRDLIVWGILDLLFLGIVPGIFVLCIKDEHLADNVKEISKENKVS